MLNPFQIRDLHGSPSHTSAQPSSSGLASPRTRRGIVQLSANDYDDLSSTHPRARLTYLDDDDGELITVGSSLELSQRLDEPVEPTAEPASVSPTTIPEPMHLFDIRRSNSVTELWKKFEVKQVEQDVPVTKAADETQTKPATTDAPAASAPADVPSGIEPENVDPAKADESPPLLAAFEAEMAKILDASRSVNDDNTPGESSAAPQGRTEAEAARPQNPADMLRNTLHNLINGGVNGTLNQGASIINSGVGLSLSEIEKGLQDVQRLIPQHVESSVQGALTLLEARMRHLTDSLNNSTVAAGQTLRGELPTAAGTVDSLRAMACELGNVGHTLFEAFETEFGCPRTSSQPQAPEEHQSHPPSEHAKPAKPSGAASAEDTTTDTKSRDAKGEGEKAQTKAKDLATDSKSQEGSDKPVKADNSRTQPDSPRIPSPLPFSPFIPGAYPPPPPPPPPPHPHPHPPPPFHDLPPHPLFGTVPPQHFTSYHHFSPPPGPPPPFWQPSDAFNPPGAFPPSGPFAYPSPSSPHSVPQRHPHPHPHPHPHTHGHPHRRHHKGWPPFLSHQDVAQSTTNNFSRPRRGEPATSDARPPAATALFVGNVGFNVNEQMIHNVFASKGFLVEVQLPQDVATGTHAGFGYLHFPSVHAAKAALEALQGTHIDGHAINLEFSDHVPITRVRSEDSPSQNASNHPAPVPANEASKLSELQGSSATFARLEPTLSKDDEFVTSKRSAPLKVADLCSSDNRNLGREASPVNGLAVSPSDGLENSSLEDAERLNSLYPSLLPQGTPGPSGSDKPAFDPVSDLARNLDACRFPPVSQLEAHFLAEQRRQVESSAEQPVSLGTAPEASSKGRDASKDATLQGLPGTFPQEASDALLARPEPSSETRHMPGETEFGASFGPRRHTRRSRAQKSYRSSWADPGASRFSEDIPRGLSSRRTEGHRHRAARGGLFESPSSEPPNSGSNARQRSIDDCVSTLVSLGYGGASDGGLQRIAVYAAAADGRVSDAIEMIEEERKAYEQQGSTI
ncbi:hypothetical protein BO70DRAFT_391945 [Aspergillus heteromorphus CBS 117.55]|uniref:RRM domain-containing protein n=1 Tax=Aspergillus heteromorphus CBS 117.55 TaxID=1448321 RepID=A0A317X1N0_9EURO|nr:uncharacterized protein BO70DRAFT_391945 [Aspergillus heteromorphus CBS 117.55]PWY92544.1 hypothetical protein BO70DRAFT_391945 [Aspergillus heteromorphus CBS 117.55]